MRVAFRKLFWHPHLAGLLCCSGAMLANDSAAAAAPSTSVSATQDATQSALRNLWVGHLFWVRNVTLETMAGNIAMNIVGAKQLLPAV